eukprot:TRINITY_DN1737_c0_g1_i1.p1 TRINITY_DN1737_c0_g1~~TRINITY_DN1737_c0_g1_i1.p1  ORF type:complete len:750 (-),score=302.75 TRINITY_DN1737_c0_g1_i1:346-2514(-)
MGASCSSQEGPYDYDSALLNDRSHQYSQVYDAHEEKNPKRGDVRRNSKRPDKLVVDPFDEKTECRTIWQAWRRGVDKFPNRNCLGTREYSVVDGKFAKDNDKNVIRGAFKYQTYAEVDAEIKAVGAGLVSLGLQPGDAVALYAMNRAEWTITNLANFSQSLRTVALYDTLGADAACYIVGHAECKVIFCTKDKVAKSIAICKKSPEVKFLVQYDVNPFYNNVEETVDEADIKAASEAGVRLLGFTELRNMGKDSGIFPREPAPEDLAFIMYTSGTTGNPKGAMLTHSNILASAAGVRDVFVLDEKDIHVSYLPLAHIFESCVQVAMVSVGGAIAFYQGSPKKLPDDFKDAHPTILCGVPRVFERIYDRVMKNVAGFNCIKKSVVMGALRDQALAVRQGRRDAAADNRVFIPMRTMMGLEQVRVVVTGAAPMAPYLMEFLKIVIGCDVCQGYGMTETAAAMSLVVPGDRNAGHVGPPTTSAEICLEDVDEMGYKHTDVNPRGEVLVRGPIVFAGYYKNEEATREAFSADGWLHTGDIGRWNPNGTLSIIDRKKNMMKLSQGEYIALEKVEGLYKNDWCSQVWVYGNSYHSFLVAVAVPAPDTVLPWLREKGYWPSDLPLSTKPEFLLEFKKQCDAHEAELAAEIHKALMEVAGRNRLSSLEKVKAPVILETQLDEMFQGFNVANDCLTPTNKFRRPFLVRRYDRKLREVYTANGEPPKPDERW